MKGLGRRVLALVCLVLVLVPAYVDTEAGVSAQATGATFITTDDNENNDHTGAPDNDMHSANPECLFNDNPVTPIEFNIVAASLPSFTTAQLSLYAWDVDEQGEVGYEPEVDEVYFNGHLVGTLTGWNDTWSTSVFQLSPSWVRQGNNLVEVRINKHYPNDHDTWCTAIDWGQLVLDRGGGEAFIKETSLDRECYIPGQTVGIFVEVDTTAASQEVEVEINILDPNGVTRAATSRRFTTYDADVDSFVEPLTLPTDAPTGPYTAQVIVYDAASMAQQDIWIGHFVVDPNCGTITPVITDTPTARPTATHTATPRPTGTSTPTATHTATPRPTGTGTPTTTPTYQPPPPPCSVTCDKSASPSTVGPGEEVVVTISLTGSNGACRVTHQNADVMLVIDKSGSMNDDTQAGGPEQPITDAKNAAKEFVGRMDLTRDQVGVVAFDSSARKAHDLSNNAGTVRTAIDGLSAGGGTDIAAGIRAAQAELSSSRHNAANAPVIVLLSDGKSDEAAARSAAEEAKRAGTRIFTIGLGAGVNPATMQAIASSPSDYYYAATGAELAAIYEQVAGAIQGRPGTNITITDVLGPGMTLVPNSFTGSPAPTVSGNTLTWKVASLGFETKTWSYRVKAPSTPGTYPVNSSAQVTYTDSNGNPGETVCPSPQITVVAGPITATLTSTPTASPTPTATPTGPPPRPPCSVTCDKSAVPSTVRTEEEVTVIISLTGSDGACVTHKNTDVMLVIDKSGSMDDDTQAGGPPQPITDAKNAAKEFVGRMDLTRDQVGVVAFDSSARKAHDLSNNAGTVRTAIDGLSAGGGTDIAAGIRAAQAELSSSRHNAANAPVIVLLSDGKSDEAAARSAAEEAKRAGTRIFTIGLGAGVNPATMQAIASSPSDYYYAATGAELAAIYEQVAGAIQGRPGTNITITDVLGPGMTLVPNSFTGSPAPTVSGNTLTWKVASLGFETKTWSYRVKAPSTPGTYPVNSSAQVTYTDSNGNPAQTSCPGPQITVVPGTEQIAEIYTKDNPPDDGSVPSSEPWWESPDIWVRHQADGSGQHQNPQFGQTNYVYVRVRNIGNTDVTNITVHVYGAKAAAAFRWPQDWTPEIGSASIANLAAGQTTTVYVPWQPPQSGHYCFLTRIEAAQDPITHDGWVKFDNNISQKNVHVLDLERGPLDSSVILVNPQRQPAYVSLFIGSTDFPAGGAVTLEFADPGLFQRWQDAGGDLVGAELIPGTTSVSIRPHSELQATIARIPMSAGEQSHINLRVEGPAGSKPIVRVTEKIEGEEIGGNIYQPPLIALLGDGNGDGLCTEIDALMALQMAVNTLSEDLNLDVDQDGQVSERDALTILTWAVRDGQCG